jgi:predicted AlkP superfamily phosphohydrolase/phosphomutase
LSENGVKVIIINVDMTYPPEKVNGILISGVLSPEPSAYPPELAGWLKERGYKVEAKGYKVTPKDEFLQDVYLTTNKRAEIALELMKAQEWDLFLIHFTGGDRIQHYLWRDMEEGSPKYGDEILKYWQHLDGIVGRMLKEVDEETTVIIMSDHGFGGLKKRIHINWWLKEKGYLKLKSDENLWGRFLFWLMGFLKKSGISDLIRNILIFFGVKPSLEVPKPHIDWSQTKAFTCGYYAGQIYLDPALRPEEYEKLRGEIIEQLKELKDPETGRRVLKGVYRVEEIYSGPFLEAGPDILLLPADDYWVVGGWSYPEIFQSRLRESGVHRVDGILLMRGAGIKSRATLRGASIIDLAPTVLHLFSIPIPEMDGRILEEVLG